MRMGMGGCNEEKRVSSAKGSRASVEWERRSAEHQAARVENRGRRGTDWSCGWIKRGALGGLQKEAQTQRQNKGEEKSVVISLQ